MDEVEVEVLDPQPLDRLADRRHDGVRAVRVAPELRRDPEVVPLNDAFVEGALERVPDLGLVAVDRGAVEVTVADPESLGDGGADLAGLVETAVEAKLREAVKTGRPSPLTTKDLAAAAKRVAPTTAEWFGTAKNHVQFANQSGQYDDVARYLGRRGSRGGDA